MANKGDAGIQNIRLKASDLADNVEIRNVLQNVANSLESLMKENSQKVNFAFLNSLDIESALERVNNSHITRNSSMVLKLSQMLKTTIKWINEKQKSRLDAKENSTNPGKNESISMLNISNQDNAVRMEVQNELDLCGVSDCDGQVEMNNFNTKITSPITESSKDENHRRLFPKQERIDSDNDSSIKDESDITDEEVSEDSEAKLHRKKRVRLDCDLCGKTLANARSLKTHKLTHMEELPFKCEQCGKTYSTGDGLKWHMKIHNEDDAVRKPHKCEQCEWRFTYLSHLEDHKQTHLPIEERRKFECPTCNKRFVSEKILAGHMKNHLDLEPKHKCHLCEKSYRHSSNLKSHMNTHADDEELKRPHKCDICGDRFTCSASMISHKKRKHFLCNDPLFEKAECDICGKILSKHYALTAHRETHMSDDDPRKTKFECSTCGKILSHKSALSAHQKRHLEENDPKLVDLKRQHTCNQCGYASITAGALKQHMIRHTGNKPFKCGLCPKRFVYENELNKHLDAHEKGTVKKPHRRTKMCNLCPKKFVRKLDLDKHLKRHEDGIAGSSSEAEGEDLEQIFSCPKCPQKFRSEWKFKMHQLLHNGRNKNKCRVCGLTFSNKSHLKRHIGRKHSDAVKTAESESRRGPEPKKKARRADSESDESHDDDDELNHEEEGRVSISKATSENETKTAIILFESELAVVQKQDDTRDSALRRLIYNICESLMQTMVCIKGRYQKRSDCAAKIEDRTEEGEDLFNVSDLEGNCDEADNNLVNEKQKPLTPSRNDSSKDKSSNRSASGHLQCNVCGKIFNWKTGNARRDLDDHLRTHLDPNDERRKPYECKVCGMRFGFHNNLAKHKRTHLAKDDPRRRRDKPVGCDVCGRILSGRDALRAHKLTHLAMDHPNQVKVKCEKCGKILMDANSLERHMLIHADDYAQKVAEMKKQITCNLCGKGFRSEHLHKIHIQTHTREFAFKCGPCDKGFAVKKAYVAHMKCHAKGTARPLQRNRLCPICPRKFRTEPQLIEHLKRHEDGTVGSSDEENFECPVCGKKCPSSSSLREHSLQHLEGEENQKPFKCDKCEKRFLRKESLKNHKRCRHPDAEYPPLEKKRVECEICGDFVYKLSAHRKIHLDDKDPEKRRFKCDECGKCYGQKMSLERHKMTIHQQSYPLSCSLCSRGCSDKWALAKHMKRHEMQTIRKGVNKKSLRSTSADRTNVKEIECESSSSESEDEISDDDDNERSDEEGCASMAQDMDK